jgi:putative secretion ATPase (PEP-CTERM system associated)
MYERFYNLRERPFALSPDPDYLYPSVMHREALGCLRYGIEEYAGFVVITGDIGCGKTTLLQTVVRELDQQTSISRLVNTMLDARELIEAIMLDFGLNPVPGQSKPHLLRELARFLVRQRSADRLALLVIDEAQNLSLSALEEVRMLSNLETEKSKLLQIVLVGQPSLRDMMSSPELEQLRQRVTVSYHLRPLGADETAEYVNHRLRCAAIGAPLEFPRDVTDLMHTHSGGVPRKLNVIGDAILLFGYGEDRRWIDVTFVRDVLEELQATGVITASHAPSAGIAPATMDPNAETIGAGNGAPLSTSPPPPTMPTSVLAATTDVALREARLAERERQLADQQRLLFEGYRLLRAEDDRGFFQASPGTPRSRPSPQLKVDTRSDSRPVGRPPASTSPELTGSAASPPEPDGLWMRLRRGLTGAPKIILED